MQYQVFERGWLSSNNILFFDDDGATLVDTGYCTHATQTLALVESALTRERSHRGANYTLTRIINTHLHSDHCGGNAALLSAYPKAEVWIPHGEMQTVTQWDETMLSYAATGQTCPRFSYTRGLSAGSSLLLGSTSWQVHAAPGHDPQSLILFEPESKLLISADALWQNGCGVIFPELLGEPGFKPALDTLDLIESLSPQKVIPGHGPPFEQTDKAIHYARERLLYLQAEPSRNASHALRVLIKFKLLDVQSIDYESLLTWAQDLPYVACIAERYYKNISIQTLISNTLVQLEKSGACKTDNSLIKDA